MSYRFFVHLSCCVSLQISIIEGLIMLKSVVPVRRVLPLRNVLFMWRLLSLLRALCLWKIIFLSRSVVPITSVKRNGWVFSLWPDLQVPKERRFLSFWRVRSRHEISVVPMPSEFSAVTSGVLVTSIVVVTSVGSVKGAFPCDGLCSFNECCAYYSCWPCCLVDCVWW